MHVPFSIPGFLAASLATLVTFAASAKMDNAKRDSITWVPPITRPSGGETFQAGSKQVASWDRAAPTGFNTTQLGQYADLMLGYGAPGPLVTLVKNVDLFGGDAEVEYTLPSDLATRDHYFLLFLTSSWGSNSPQFTIQGGGAPPKDEETTSDPFAPSEEEEEEEEDDNDDEGQEDWIYFPDQPTPTYDDEWIPPITNPNEPEPIYEDDDEDDDEDVDTAKARRFVKKRSSAARKLRSLE